MTLPEPLFQRLLFLVRVVKKEITHLDYSYHKIFKLPLTLARISSLDRDLEFAEQLEAFTSRFCRLQDSLGDKLLPAWLANSRVNPRPLGRGYKREPRSGSSPA